MLRFVPDHRKIKNMCKHAVKKLPFVKCGTLESVPYQYTTKEM